MTAKELKALMIKHGMRPDEGIATHILHACETTKLPLSYALALVEKESGGRNVFGHDPVRNPVKGGRVTWARYKKYKLYRKRGWGMQGVGPVQLTWFSFQDDADKAGGAHKPYPNMVVGFRRLRELTREHGKQGGAQRYNGSGDAAEAYGRDFVVRQERWHKALT